jgi:hypothetical protein
MTTTKKNEDDLKERRRKNDYHKKIEDDLNWQKQQPPQKLTQLKESTLMGCDIIVRRGGGQILYSEGDKHTNSGGGGDNNISCLSLTCLRVGIGYSTYVVEKQRIKQTFPLAPMRVLAPESSLAGPSPLPPIDMSGNFPAAMSAESPSNISPNHSEIQNPRTSLENPPLVPQKVS